MLLNYNKTANNNAGIIGKFCDNNRKNNKLKPTIM